MASVWQLLSLPQWFVAFVWDPHHTLETNYSSEYYARPLAKATAVLCLFPKAVAVYIKYFVAHSWGEQFGEEEEPRLAANRKNYGIAALLQL